MRLEKRIAALERELRLGAIALRMADGRITRIKDEGAIRVITELWNLQLSQADGATRLKPSATFRAVARCTDIDPDHHPLLHDVKHFAEAHS